MGVNWGGGLADCVGQGGRCQGQAQGGGWGGGQGGCVGCGGCCQGVLLAGLVCEYAVLYCYFVCPNIIETKPNRSPPIQSPITKKSPPKDPHPAIIAGRIIKLLLPSLNIGQWQTHLIKQSHIASTSSTSPKMITITSITSNRTWYTFQRCRR